MQTLHSRNSPKMPRGNSDFDFNDGFGGPPRWVLIREIRHSERAESRASRRNDETGNPWSGLSEKPVLSEEGLSRKRYTSDNFFDDIFRRSESLCSPTPRKYEKEHFSSSPSFRVLSPAKPLPPKAKPLGSLLPAQFSLPAKLDDGMVLPTFGSATGGTNRNKDGESKGAISWQRGVTGLIKRDETETRSNSMKGLNDSEVLNSSSRFHFSVHKWASKGIPLGMPLLGGNV